jgi:hypothetical protein
VVRQRLGACPSGSDARPSGSGSELVHQVRTPAHRQVQSGEGQDCAGCRQGCAASSAIGGYIGGVGERAEKRHGIDVGQSLSCQQVANAISRPFRRAHVVDAQIRVHSNPKRPYVKHHRPAYISAPLSLIVIGSTPGSRRPGSITDLTMGTTAPGQFTSTRISRAPNRVAASSPTPRALTIRRSPHGIERSTHATAAIPRAPVASPSTCRPQASHAGLRSPIATNTSG